MSYEQARRGMDYLEQAVLAVLREAAPNYLGPAAISEQTGIFGESLEIDGTEKVTSHSIVGGILAKLYSDGHLKYKYDTGWRLMRYCVYDGRDTKSYTMIHEETCPYHDQHCKRYWYCLFETKADALRKAGEIGRLQDLCCEKCNP